jgi:hypothetical protein
MKQYAYSRSLGRSVEVEVVNSDVAPVTRKPNAIFVKFPNHWRKLLRGASGTTYGLAIELLFLKFRNRGLPIILSNQVLGKFKVSRPTKWRAVIDLEARGVISIERRHRKSPRITVLD